MKQCTKCEVKKPLDCFHKHKGMKDGHRNTCIDCYREERKYKMYEFRYGLTYEEAMEIRRSPCQICGQSNELCHVDHCHTTGKVRGALCPQCNTAIGLLKDDVDLLLNAVEYLQMTRILE